MVVRKDKLYIRKIEDGILYNWEEVREVSLGSYNNPNLNIAEVKIVTGKE